MISKFLICYLKMARRWKTAEEFYLYPCFEIDTDLSIYEIPIEFDEKWYKFVGKNILISDLNPSERSFKAKERYELFFKYEEFFEIFPPLLIILAESYFWLENICMCKDLLVKFLYIVKTDEQLEYIIYNLDECIEMLKIEDDLYHNNEGDDRIEDAILFKYDGFINFNNEEIDYDILNLALERWKKLQNELTEKIALDHFIRYACIATNELEGVFELSGNTWPKLIKRGFYINSIDGISKLSRERKKDTIIKILINTSASMDLVKEILLDYNNFNEEYLNTIHLTLMENCKFHENYVEYEIGNEIINYISYRLITVGKFRNVACRTTHNDDKEIVQFCHHSKLKNEMSIFCDKVRKLLNNKNIDPFEKAAWIHLNNIMLHPYEKSNGIIARMLSSIPLMEIGLPPMIIIKNHYHLYYNAINECLKIKNTNPLKNFLIKSYTVFLETDFSKMKISNNDGKTIIRKIIRNK